MMNAEKIVFNYKFKLSDYLEKEIYVELDSQTLRLIKEKRESYPEWTELSFFKCPN